jgi:hypothetical protein
MHDSDKICIILINRIRPTNGRIIFNVSGYTICSCKYWDIVAHRSTSNLGNTGYQEILSHRSDYRVKVCFITAFEEYNNQFNELFHGLEEVNCFIRKPIALKTLTEKVKSQLQ